MLNVYKINYDGEEMRDVIVTSTASLLAGEELDRLSNLHGISILPPIQVDEAMLGSNRRERLLLDLDTANVNPRRWTWARAYWFFDCPEHEEKRREAIEAAIRDVLGED